MLIYQQSNATNQLNVIINATTTAGTTLAADVVLEKTIVSGASTVSADFGPSIKNFNIITVEGETPSSVTYTDNKITINGLKAALGSNNPITTKIELPLTVVSSVAATTGANNSGKITTVTNGTSATFQIPGWDDKLTKNTDITAGTSCKITYDAKGLVTAGASLMADDIPELSAAKITSGTFDVARIPDLDASKITSGQFADGRIASATTWNNKIGSLTAGSFIEITGSGDSRTIAVTTTSNTPTQGFIAQWGENGRMATKDPVNSSDSVNLSYANNHYLGKTATAVNASSLGGQSPAYYAAKSEIPSTYIQSASVSVSTLTLWDQAGTTLTFSPEIPDGAIAYAGGHDSVLQKVTSIPGESTVRSNEINTITNFGAVLGERNHLGYTTDDNWSAYTADETHGSNGTAVVGGANVISQTEDAFVFGYKNRTFSAHQSIIGGYKNKVYASESAVFGEKHTINGALYEAEGAIKTNTRKIAVFGGENTIGVGCQWDLVAGQSITINQYGKWVFSVGAKNRMDNSNEAVNQLGWNNQTGTYITDSTQIGYDNTTGNGASNNKLFNIVQIGHSNYSNKSETYMLGYNLTTQHTSQVILGRFNADVSSKDVLVVGCGHAADTNHGVAELQENCFTAGKDGDNKYIKVGGTTLTETQLQSLLAIINSSSSSNSNSGSDSGYEHNWGGDATPETT